MIRLLLTWFILLQMISTFFLAHATTQRTGAGHSLGARLLGRPYVTSWDEEERDDGGDIYDPSSDSAGGSRRNGLFVGTGREFNLFDSAGTEDRRRTRWRLASNHRQGGHDQDDDYGYEYDSDYDYGDFDDYSATKSDVSRGGSTTTTTAAATSRHDVDSDSESEHMDEMYSLYGRPLPRASSTSSSPSNSQSPSRSLPTNRYYYRNSGIPTRRRQRRQERPNVFQKVQNWWTSQVSPNLKDMPKIAIRVEPTTTLKIRKTFRPLKTIVRIGADYNTQVGVWQFTSSWEDAIIGSKITLAGRELQLSKSWQLSVGAVEDLVTRLRFRAAIDLTTFKAYARIGFRTERLSPINVMEGFTLMKRLPLDGAHGNVKLEVKANFALPEPEIEYSTETQRSLVGMGDIEVSIDELNLLLDY